MPNALVEQMSVLYGEPKTTDPVSFVAAYENALRNVDEDTLVDAANIIARTRNVTAWPTIAECLDAVADARRRAKARGMDLTPIDNWDSWFGGLKAQCAHAMTQAEIDAAVAKVVPYCKAMWCLPTRADELREVGAKRMNDLRKQRPVRNPTGEAA